MSNAFDDMVGNDLDDILTADTPAEEVTYISKATGIKYVRYAHVMRGKAMLEEMTDGRGVDEVATCFISTDPTTGVRDPQEQDAIEDRYGLRWIVKGVARVVGGAHLNIERYRQKQRSGDGMYIQR